MIRILLAIIASLLLLVGGAVIYIKLTERAPAPAPTTPAPTAPTPVKPAPGVKTPVQPPKAQGASGEVQPIGLSFKLTGMTSDLKKTQGQFILTVDRIEYANLEDNTQVSTVTVIGNIQNPLQGLPFWKNPKRFALASRNVGSKPYPASIQVKPAAGGLTVRAVFSKVPVRELRAGNVNLVVRIPEAPVIVGVMPDRFRAGV